jgi:hypothetical protein
VSDGVAVAVAILGLQVILAALIVAGGIRDVARAIREHTAIEPKEPTS